MSRESDMHPWPFFDPEISEGTAIIPSQSFTLWWISYGQTEIYVVAFDAEDALRACRAWLDCLPPADGVFPMGEPIAVRNGYGNSNVIVSKRIDPETRLY